MPLPVTLFVLLLALNLGSVRAADESPNPTATESISENVDARQAPGANVFEDIGRDCSSAPCTAPLTCNSDKKCDCDKPDNKADCSCTLGGGHVYRRWEKDPKDSYECKLAYGETPCKTTGGEKWEMCGPGLKCQNNFCKTSATSVTSPYSVGALVISALVMMTLK